MTFRPLSPILLAVEHIQQRYTGECLAACVAMACSYLGMPKDYDRLVNVLGIERGVGAPFFSVHNLVVEGIAAIYRQDGTLKELHSLLLRGWPSITSVQTGELLYWDGISARHVVLVVGMDSEHIHLHDPELPDGPTQVPIDEFDLAWLEQGERYAVLLPV